ncbi:MAG: ATP-dependent helicase HrpB [Acidobacteriota bacterium]|nr:ATP-dependent helicase HrpB [Acidobacteriota bacterium]
MLPIEILIPQIIESLRTSPNLVLEAAPGAGKTTRVPPALLEFGGDVVVLEPRRIAARMAARRVAHEIGEPIGGTVGYQVRFEESAGPRTRLRFVTEGVLTRRMISDPLLKGVGTVILDEFHERHLETDLALALLRRLQKTQRPDLRIVVMSATMDPAPIRAFLGDCPLLRSEGRLFELTIAHTVYSAAPLEEQVAAALQSAIAGQGDVLVFLPGAAEIRKAARACEGIARWHDLLIAPLYGDLSPAEQDRAVEPASQRKVILSTNIAESSITIEGVRLVIDSGLARIAGDSPWTGLPSLEVKRIGKASARQRAGRAGRTAAGQVIRLYTAEDFQRRADHDEPEILRRELSQLCLQLEAAGVRDPLEIEWLDQPPAGSLTAAEQLLDRLGARGAAAAKMARLPLHPRLARLIMDAGGRGAQAAALLSSGQRVKSSDFLRALDEEWDGRTKAVYDQVRRFVTGTGKTDDTALRKAILAAFPDRVGRWRPDGTVLLSAGGSAAMPLAPGEFIVAIDVATGVDHRAERPLIRLACAIEPDWLLDRAAERTGPEWNRRAERVEGVTVWLYDRLTIDETRGGVVDDEPAAKLLAAKAMEAGVDRFVKREDLAEFCARVEFAGLSDYGEAEITDALTTLCHGLRSFAELEKAAAGLVPMLEEKAGRKLLDELAPPRLKLPGGRVTRVHYERGKPPWVASRLQDFFGMTESPRIGREKVPLVIHLLAPNQRAVQTTTDLAGFWLRLYPQLRKELGRRYPRHAWPEKPV